MRNFEAKYKQMFVDVRKLFYLANSFIVYDRYPCQNDGTLIILPQKQETDTYILDYERSSVTRAKVTNEVADVFNDN